MCVAKSERERERENDSNRRERLCPSAGPEYTVCCFAPTSRPLLRCRRCLFVPPNEHCTVAVGWFLRRCVWTTVATLHPYTKCSSDTAYQARSSHTTHTRPESTHRKFKACRTGIFKLSIIARSLKKLLRRNGTAFTLYILQCSIYNVCVVCISRSLAGRLCVPGLSASRGTQYYFALK